MSARVAESIRRWRPHTIERLERALDGSSAGLLLVGARGSGLAELVLAAAQHLSCASGGCGECSVCVAIAEGRHPDVRILSDAPSVAEVRALVAHARQSADRWRIAGLVGIERMASVAPVVLKALEEPGPRTRWLLAASAIPPELTAMASRCVRVQVDPPSEAEIEAACAQAGVELSPILVSLVPRDLELVRTLGSVPEPRSWLERWVDLATGAHTAHPAVIAASLRPPSSLPSSTQEALVRLGLAVAIRANPMDAAWGQAVRRASTSLARRLSIALVLAELALERPRSGRGYTGRSAPG